MNPLRRRVLLLVPALATGRAGAQASRPARWLTITVREDPPQSTRPAPDAPHGAVTLDSRGGVASNRGGNASVITTRTSEQVLRVLEGTPVPIQIQTAVPMTFRHFVAGSGAVDEVRGTVTYDALVQFVATPRVAGRIVTLEIEPNDASLVADQRERSRMSINAQGNLGEWIAIGGAQAREDTDTSASATTLQARTRPVTNQRGVWLKVDLESGTRR